MLLHPNSVYLEALSSVVGSLYFAAWAVSFYPQIYNNWRRKSVVGLSFDFVTLNVVGFILYSFFNVGLFWFRPMQEMYFSAHPHGINPVRLNDVLFSVHASFASVFTLYQCAIYESGNQTVSKAGYAVHTTLFSILFMCLGLAGAAVITWLDFLYMCSYEKLAITFIKYVPQAYMNYSRQSTVGWSIGNVLLDFTGGVLSIFQMVILAYNHDDWSSIFGDFTKFGLGIFTIMFDVTFMIQHFVLYRKSAPLDNDGDDACSTSDEDTKLLLQNSPAKR